MPGKIDNALIGAAGVHFVVSELSLRGLIALPTIRNAPGIDVVVVDPCGSWRANLQVKTSQSKVRFWPVGAKYSNFSGPYNFYVFVRYLNRESRFEAFLVPADEANAHIREIFEEGRTQGYKDWAPCWYLPENETLVQACRDNWRTFGP